MKKNLPDQSTNIFGAVHQISKTLDERCISDLVAEVVSFMSTHGYSKSYIQTCNCTWNKLCKMHGNLNIVQYTNELIKDFMKECLGFGNPDKSVNVSKAEICSLNILYNFLHYQRASWRKIPEPAIYSSLLNKPFQAYLSRLRKTHQESTIANKQVHLKRFDVFLCDRGIDSLDAINQSFLVDFLKYLPSRSGDIKNTVSTLRNVLRFMYEQGFTTKDCSAYVPKIHMPRNATVPSTFTKDEIIKLLSSIDRGNPVGKRDYALLSVLCRLGLRTSDLLGLKFNNLHWDTCTIELIQQKTGTLLTLPLLNEVGEAIIDYLQHARPKVDSPYVFLRAIPPWHELERSTIHYIVHKRLINAGINIPPKRQHGAHAIRHSLATLLLGEGTALPVISETLGHTCTASTMHYLDIDLSGLRKCILEMPAIIPFMEGDTSDEK